MTAAALSGVVLGIVALLLCGAVVVGWVRGVTSDAARGRTEEGDG